VRIVISPTFSQIEDCPRELYRTLRAEMSTYRKNYQFFTSFQKGQWDGKVHFIQRKIFPTGLWKWVRDLCKEHGFVIKWKINYQVLGDSVDPNTIVLNEVNLRDYQQDAIRFIAKKRRCIIKVGTGGGKTEIIAAVTLLWPQAKCLILVHRKNLLLQTADRVSMRTGETVGKIGEGQWDTSQRITVALVQTLWSRTDESAKFLSEINTLMLDECHHSSAFTWESIAGKCLASIRIGFSGTPIEKDDEANLRLMGMTGMDVYEKTSKSLIDEGYLSVPHIQMIESQAPPLPRQVYPKQYVDGIVLNEWRNDRIIQEAEEHRDKGQRIMILVHRIKHGLLLNKMLGRRSIFLSGKDPARDRLKAVRILESDYPLIIIATNIFEEGQDIPSLDTLIIACGGKAPIGTIQRVGRGLRKTSQKDSVNIIDFIDLHDKKYLLKHSIEREAIYRREQFDVYYSPIEAMA